MPKQVSTPTEASAVKLADDDLETVLAGAAVFKAKATTPATREVVPDGFVQTFPPHIQIDVD